MLCGYGKADMISVELWRATIGLSISKCYSGSLSSLSCALSFKCGKRSSSDVVRQDEPDPALHTDIAKLWRHRIGVFTANNGKQCFGHGCLFLFSPYGHRSLVVLVLAINLLAILLIISGDVETNPGPLSCE